MKPKHTKSKKTKSFSLLIVPDSNDIKQISMPSWVPKFLILLVIVTIASSSYYVINLYQSFHQLEKEHIVATKNLEVLNDITSNQNEEIETLESTIAQFNKELKSISELQTTVKSLVGLDNSKEGQADNNSTMAITKAEPKEYKKQATSSPNRSGNPLLRKAPLDLDYSLNMDIEIESISSMLDQSQKDLSVLIDDVEKKLAYLEAKPNLEPTVGRITSPFGYRSNPFGSGRDFHTGIDIANGYRIPIKAAGSGIVTFSGYNGGYGRVIVIKHGYGYESIYAHNNKLLVKVGDRIEKGQKIAEMGNTGRSTGPHLHFEIRYNSKPINPKTVLNNNK